MDITDFNVVQRANLELYSHPSGPKKPAKHRPFIIMAE
jgi:hypothetical protein